MRNYDKWKAEQLKKEKGNFYFEYWIASFDGFIFEAFKAGEKSGISRTADTLEKIRTSKPKGKLKAVNLCRAENLSPETRKKFNLPDEGLCAMETREVPSSSKEKERN